MAIDDEPSTQTPDVAAFAAAWAAQQFDPANLEKQQRVLENAGAEVVKFIFFGLTAAVSQVVGPIMEGMLRGEAASEGAYSKVAAAALGAMFDVNVDSSQFRPFSPGGNEGAARIIGDAVLRGMAEPHEPLEPGDANAKKYIGTMVNIGVEGWLNGFVFELLESVGTFGWVKGEKFGELKDIMVNVLGLSRLSRRVFGPYVNTLVVEPFRWQLNKTYRPEMLGAGLLARDLARGRRTREAVFEELARQGWSDDRIEAMLSDARKRLSVSDVMYLHREWGYTTEWMQAQLKDQSYDDDAITLLVDLENAKRYRSHMEDAAAAAAAGFIDGGLDRADLLATMSEVYQDAHERELVLAVVDLKKRARHKRLSDGDAKDAVLRGILSMVDYRRWLEAEGYDEESAATKELLLQSELRDRDQAASARARIANDRAAAAAQKKTEDDARRAELEAKQRALGPGVDDIKRAVVRGLIPIGRYEQALSVMHLDAGDVAFLVDGVNADRAAYVAQEKKRAAAGPEAATRQLSLGDLDAAVLAGALSLGDYAQRLNVAGFSSDDAGVLVAVLKRKIDDQAANQDLRESARVALLNKPVPLAAAERAVERGVWSLAQYEDLLRSAGFNDGAVATLSALMRDKLEQLAQAQRRRDELGASGTAPTVTLGTLEQAVIRGLQPLSVYAAYLAKNGYSADDQQLLVALLRSKADDAAAARATHDQALTEPTTKPLTLAQLERAVLLGTVSMDAYRGWLADQAYAADTIDVLVGNLTIELQAKREQEQQRADAAAAAETRGVSLAQAEAATLSGLWPVDRFRAWLRAEQFSDEAVTTIVDLMMQKLAAQVDAGALASNIDAQLKTRELSLSQWADAVKGGYRTLPDYGAFLVAQGFSLADAQILVALLAEKLAAPATAAAGGG